LCGVRKGLEGKVWRMMTWIFWPSGFEQIDHGSLGSVHHQRGKSGVQSLQEPGCGCGWWNMCIEKRRTGRTGALWRRNLEFNTSIWRAGLFVSAVVTAVKVKERGEERRGEERRGEERRLRFSSANFPPK